jgi:hypothetical protein
MSLDRLKKLLIKVNEEGEVASPDGTLSDLGELPKFNYGTVDARGKSVKGKNPKKIKKKKDNTYETEEEFDFYPKNVKGWRDKWDEIMPKFESLNEAYPRIVKVEKLEEDPEYIFEDEDKNIKAILDFLKVDKNVDFIFIKEDEDDIIVYGGNGNPEPNKDIYLIERKY